MHAMTVVDIVRWWKPSALHNRVVEAGLETVCAGNNSVLLQAMNIK